MVLIRMTFMFCAYDIHSPSPVPIVFGSTDIIPWWQILHLIWILHYIKVASAPNRRKNCSLLNNLEADTESVNLTTMVTTSFQHGKHFDTVAD